MTDPMNQQQTGMYSIPLTEYNGQQYYYDYNLQNWFPYYQPQLFTQSIQPQQNQQQSTGLSFDINQINYNYSYPCFTQYQQDQSQQEKLMSESFKQSSTYQPLQSFQQSFPSQLNTLPQILTLPEKTSSVGFNDDSDDEWDTWQSRQQKAKTPTLERDN